MTTKHSPSAMPKWWGKVPARYSESRTSGIAPSAGPHGAARSAEQRRDQHLEGPRGVEGDVRIDVGVAQRQQRAPTSAMTEAESAKTSTFTRVVLIAGVAGHGLVLADGAQREAEPGAARRASSPRW